MERQPPNSPGNPTAAVSIAVLVIDVILLAHACWMTTHVRDALRRIFESFETKLPALTSRLMAVPGYVFVLVLLGIAALLVAKEILVPDAFVRLLLNLVVGVGLFALSAALTVAFLLPLLDLIQKLT